MGEPAAWVAGDIWQAWEAGCETSRSFASLWIPRRAARAVSSCGGFPLDLDLYQATKALFSPLAALEPGAPIVLVADLEDSLGRTWQCGTIQLDMQMPERFDLEYVGADGEKHRPVMIHRVCFGSIERFIGILTEHFAGKFPTWLAPVQVKVLPVSDKSLDYSRKVFEALKNTGVRVELDDRNEKIGYKIRSARQIDRVPYMLILGEKEITDNTVSVRDRATDQTETMSLEAFMAKLDKEVKERI